MTDHEKLMLIKKMTDDICRYDIQDEGWLRATIEHVDMVAGFEETDCRAGEADSQ